MAAVSGQLRRLAGSVEPPQCTLWTWLLACSFIKSACEFERENVALTWAFLAVPTGFEPVSPP